jgi:hypothetical protein
LRQAFRVCMGHHGHWTATLNIIQTANNFVSFSA